MNTQRGNYPHTSALCSQNWKVFKTVTSPVLVRQHYLLSFLYNQTTKQPNMSIPPKELADSNLFKPIKVGSVELKNRVVYAPTTRFRSTDDFVATDSMLEYYTKRAIDTGLIITEATFPSLEFGLYDNAPCIKTPSQVTAFKKIVDSVHSKGAAFAVQLWGLGRVADPKLLKKHNLPFVAPSAIYLDDESEKAAKEANNELRELTVAEIKDLVKEFAASARRSVDEAGFDIVEIHSAHMYLLDQFLQASSNKRTDEYGGSIENNARFVLEIVDACIEAVGAEHVAIRLSPYAIYQGALGINSEINPIVTWGYVLSELERRAKNGNRLAYISIVEPRMSSSYDNPEAYGVDFTWPDLIWKGPIIRAGGFLDPANIDQLPDFVNKNDHTLIGFGRHFTSNPDLTYRLKEGLELTPYDRPTFFTPTNVGYLDYDTYGKPLDHSKDNTPLKPLA